jgi:hypothetical protein
MLRDELDGEAVSMEPEGLAWFQQTVLTSAVETDARPKAEAFARLSVLAGESLCLWTTFRSSVNAPEYHKTETRTWQDRGRASFDNGGIGYRRGRFGVFLGRDEMSWGMNRARGLLFSGSAPSFDMLKVSFGTDRLLFTSFHSQLRRGSDEDWDAGVRRYVSGHRLEVLVEPRFTCSLSEVVVYGGVGRTFEPVYLNPFTAFYAEQWNSEYQDNILISGDFSMLFPQRAEIRGEIMIDDFQYDFSTEPQEFGTGIEIAAINPMYPEASMLGASYFHIRNRTYGHYVDWNRHVHEGRVMGYPDGPDGDRLTVWTSVASPPPVLWRLDYVYGRKGEGRATDDFERVGETVTFPSGIVERSHTIGLDVSWRPEHRWSVTGRAEWNRRENIDHIDGETESGFNLMFNATFNLRLASKR